MTSLPPLPDDLRALFDAACDDALNEQQVAALEQCLRNDPTAAAAYLEYFRLQTDLRMLTRSQRAATAVLANVASQVGNVPVGSTVAPAKAAGETRWLRLIAALSSPTPLSLTVAAIVISAIVGIMAFIVVPFRSPRPADDMAQTDFVAQLTRSIDARWADPNRAKNAGAPLPTGQVLELSEGLIEITFRSGARTVLQGPARAIVTSDMEYRLEEGRTTANVPATAHGFAVNTPVTRIVDLGTEFGVAVEREAGDVQVHVFAGSVQLETPRPNEPQQSPETMLLKAGEAIRVRADHSVEHIASNEEIFVRKLPVLIAEVPDPVHQWTFNDSTPRDSVGSAHGTLARGASLSGGRLYLDGSPQAFMRTDSISRDILSKTLVAWVSLHTLDQSGGSALTLESNDGRVFDGIVYGERSPRQWMAGSNAFLRSPIDNLGDAETLTAPATVMIALVQRSDGSVQIYRDGVIYASYRTEVPPKFLGGSACALFGKRHTGAGSWRMDASIDEARIYAQPLSPRQIRQLYEHGPVAMEK